MVTITHNFSPDKFKFFWTKYVKEGNLKNHCVQCMRGSFSKKFSKALNKDSVSGDFLPFNSEIVFDEFPEDTYSAIYICGVSNKYGSTSKKNYPHNVHIPIIPKEGASDTWEFDGWRVDIKNGYVDQIPAEHDLHPKFFKPPYNEHYFTCRNFRWMIGRFYPDMVVESVD